MGILIKVIRIVQITLLVALITIGGCIELLFWDYQGESPCIARGEALGMENIEEYVQETSYSPAQCGGFRGGTYIRFDGLRR